MANEPRFLQIGTHEIDETFFDRTVYCDCDGSNVGLAKVGMHLILKSNLPVNHGIVHFTRLEEGGNDHSDWIKITAEQGNISNWSKHILQMENDWAVLEYFNDVWRLKACGQGTPLGRRHHRTRPSWLFDNKQYRVTDGDRGAVVRCTLYTASPPSGVNGSLAVVLPNNEIMGRTGDYAAGFVVGVQLTANHLPTHPSWDVAVVPRTQDGHSIAGKNIHRIGSNDVDTIYWFNYDAGGQWFPESIWP